MTLKVMISFVGNNDPISERTNQEGAALAIAKKIKPDVVYLLPSAEGPGIQSSTEERARMTKDLLKDEISREVYIRPLMLQNPADFTEVLIESKKEIRTILEHLDSLKTPFELHLNVTSGTPQMAQSLIVLAHGGFFPAPTLLWQALNPEYAQGERIRSIDTHFLEEENILHSVQKYAEQYVFSVIAIELRRLSTISAFHARRSLAEDLERLFLSYAAWDHLDYVQAHDRLRSVYRRFRAVRDLSALDEVLAAQIEFLDDIRNKDLETLPLLVDLYYNAERAFARKAYADVLARFWRLYEGSLRYILRTEYRLNPDDFRQSFLESTDSALREWVHRNEGKLSERQANVWEMHRLLDEVGNRNFKRLLNMEIEIVQSGSKTWKKMNDVMKDLRDKRNASIVAHGLRSVSEIDATNALIAGRTMIDVLFAEGEAIRRRFPLTLESLKKVLDVLSQM